MTLLGILLLSTKESLGSPEGEISHIEGWVSALRGRRPIHNICIILATQIAVTWRNVFYCSFTNYETDMFCAICQKPERGFVLLKILLRICSSGYTNSEWSKIFVNSKIMLLNFFKWRFLLIYVVDLELTVPMLTLKPNSELQSV